MNIDRGKTSQAPDIQVRREALDTRRSFILEAPAGSGKTALLTARFLALLADVGHPRQILAVTFTRKAAAEMADRITRTLRQAQDNSYTAPPDSWEARLLELARKALKVHPDWDVLLRSPDAFLVDTFHGFCGRVARNWPLEARTPPAFELLDEIGQRRGCRRGRIRACFCRAIRACTAEIAAFQQDGGRQQQCPRRFNQLADLHGATGGLLAITSTRLHKTNWAAHGTARQHYLGRLTYFVRQKANWLTLQLFDETETEMAKTLTADIRATLRDTPGNRPPMFSHQGGTPRKIYAGIWSKLRQTPQADFIRLPPEIAWIRGMDERRRSHRLRGIKRACALPAPGALGKLMNACLDFMERAFSAIGGSSGGNQTGCPGDSLIFHEHLRHILVDEARTTTRSHSQQ